MSRVSKSVSAYFSEIGAKGGAAGKGSKKRRDAAHYKRLADMKKKAAKKFGPGVDITSGL